MSDPILEQEEQVKPYLHIEFEGLDSAAFRVKANQISSSQILMVADWLRVMGEQQLRTQFAAEARKAAAEKMDMAKIQAMLGNKGPLPEM